MVPGSVVSVLYFTDTLSEQPIEPVAGVESCDASTSAQDADKLLSLAHSSPFSSESTANVSVPAVETDVCLPSLQSDTSPPQPSTAHSSTCPNQELEGDDGNLPQLQNNGTHPPSATQPDLNADLNAATQGSSTPSNPLPGCKASTSQIIPRLSHTYDDYGELSSLSDVDDGDDAVTSSSSTKPAKRKDDKKGGKKPPKGERKGGKKRFRRQRETSEQRYRVEECHANQRKANPLESTGPAPHYIGKNKIFRITPVEVGAKAPRLSSWGRANPPKSPTRELLPRMGRPIGHPVCPV